MWIGDDRSIVCCQRGRGIGVLSSRDCCGIRSVWSIRISCGAVWSSREEDAGPAPLHHPPGLRPQLSSPTPNNSKVNKNAS